jgi:WXG100 family type VII secretion target
MADTIKGPDSELFKRAQAIRQQADAVRNEIRTLSDTITGIQWMGKRAERFFQMWDEAKPKMEEWAATLEGFATDLENQARRMQTADESF